MTLQPVNVRTIRAELTFDHGHSPNQLRAGAGIDPLFGQTMAVSERDRSRAVMITGWNINQLSTGFAVYHVHSEPAVIDTVFPFVDEHPGITRPWTLQIRHF